VDLDRRKQLGGHGARARGARSWSNTLKRITRFDTIGFEPIAQFV
jgi:hypothetical protein